MSRGLATNSMQTLLDLFAAFTERNQEIAFELRAFRTFRFSYADLDRLSRTTADFLESKGIGKGMRVVIWAPNSPWWVIACFGVWLRGGIAVPVDFASDNARARWITQVSGSKFALASRYKAGVALDVETVMMEELESILSSSEKKSCHSEPVEGRHDRMLRQAQHDNVASSDDIVLLIYTSGTTGEPKGVPLTHANLMANVAALQQHVEVLSSDVFLSVLPLSHSFEMMAGCLVPLSVGARIVYLKTIKPSAIFEALSGGTITVFASVPRLLLLLKGSIEQKFERLHLSPVFKSLRKFSSSFPPHTRKKIFRFIHKKIGPHFRYFVSGGAALDLEVARFWDDLGFTVLEGYGLTECSPVLTANQPGKVRLGTVGTAVPGVEVRVAGDGEIETRGPNIFSGYADNSSATAGAFTADGWFKTGDVGSFDPDGFLTIKTRKKDMIVTGAGMNVYPEDVEAVLGQVKGVKECTVIGIDRGQGETVHAVLVLEGRCEAAQIVAEANKNLDTLQHITDWTVWNGELPKTTTMKVKKAEVRNVVRADDRSSVLTGEGGKRGMVKMIIGTVLKMDPSTIEDGQKLVTDLHLTSLDRADLLARLEQEVRLDLPEDAVGRDTTVGELVKIVEQRKRLKSSHHMRAWAFAKSWQTLRAVLFTATVRVWMRWLGRPQVKGLEHLFFCKEPFVLASNHASYFDQPMTLAVLPRSMAGKIATAAREDFFFDDSFGWIRKLWGKISFEFCTFVQGAFLLPIGKNVQESLKFMGQLADQGIPIFIYPEGERSWDGSLLSFQPGLARIVQELTLPVVPMRIQGMEEIFPRGSARIRRGHAVVSFGEPLRFGPGAPVEEILEKTKQAILAL